MASNTSSQGCFATFFSDFQSGYLYFPIGVILLCQSALTVLTIWRTPALHTNPSVLVAALAVGDIFLASACFILGFAGISSVEVMNVNTVDSFLLGAFSSACLFSLTIMAGIAVDRYVYIAHPFFYMTNMTQKRSLKFILAVVGEAAVWEMIPLLFYRDDTYHEFCIILRPPIVYQILVVFHYFVCIIIVFIFYFKIALLAFRHKKSMNARRLRFDVSDPTYLVCCNRTAAFKSARNFAILFGTFFVFSFPLGAVCVVDFSGGGWSESLGIGVLISFLLFCTGSIVNFAVNICMNNPFGRGVREMITCKGKLRCKKIRSQS